MTPSRSQRTIDLIISRGRRLEADREILVIRAVADQLAIEMAAITEFATDHRSALEWIKGEPLIPDRHEPLCCGTAGLLGRNDLTNPPSLQALPGENLTGLQRPTQVPLASSDESEKEQRQNTQASQTAPVG
ncbi:MAG: hypothetical protein WA864_19450 [Acetobacteraceae bacterium]